MPMAVAISARGDSGAASLSTPATSAVSSPDRRSQSSAALASAITIRLAAMIESRVRRAATWTSGEGVFVGAGAVDRRDRHAQQPQVDGELAAMVVPVVEHDVAQHRHAREGEQLAVALHHRP